MSGIFDPTERFLDWDEATRQDQDALRSRIWTAMPVIIGRHIPDKMTVEAQPSVQLAVLQQTGELQWHSIPSAPDMPLLYLGGGGAVMTIPVQQGDEGLAVYASRSIDNWWQNGGVQPQSHTRTHSLSDSFVIPGFRSQARKLPNISTTTWQLRTEDGRSHFDFNPKGGNNARGVLGGQFTITAPDNPTAVIGLAFNTTVQTHLHNVSDAITATAQNAINHVAQQIGGLPGAAIGAALSHAEQALGAWQAITNGSFQVPINNVIQQVTGLNFSAVQSLEDVAHTVTTALGIAGSMNWNSLGQAAFSLASATTGINSAVGFLSAIPGIGTDISGLLKMTQQLGNIVAGIGPARNAINILAQGQIGLMALNQILHNTPLTHHTGNVTSLGRIDAGGGFFVGGVPIGGGVGPPGPAGSPGPAGPPGPAASTVVISSGNLSVAQPSNAITNLGSIVLTPGDWDVYGSIAYLATGAVLTDVYCAISDTSQDASETDMTVAPWARLTSAAMLASRASATPPALRKNVTVNTTMYLVAYCTFGSGTVTAQGIIWARRAH